MTSQDRSEVFAKLKVWSFLIGIAAAVVLVAVSLSDGQSSDEPSGEATAPVVRADDRRLNDGSTDITFVEFLDYECEACRAAHPAIEQLRADYGDRVTFVVRNFPLHDNSEAAARAAEAAAEQGKFEDLYDLLFATQSEWGEQTSDQTDYFFGLAQQLDLDMEAFRATYDDPATLEKIRRDKADGESLGVRGTPTFFLDGEMLSVNSFEDLERQMEEAVGR